MSFARARKVTVAVLGFTTAAGIGTVTCAYLYPDFRSDVERKIPQSKELFAQILDSGYRHFARTQPWGRQNFQP
jgi:hypothetical protein